MTVTIPFDVVFYSWVALMITLAIRTLRPIITGVEAPKTGKRSVVRWTYGLRLWLVCMYLWLLMEARS